MTLGVLLGVRDGPGVGEGPAVAVTNGLLVGGGVFVGKGMVGVNEAPGGGVLVMVAVKGGDVPVCVTPGIGV